MAVGRGSGCRGAGRGPAGLARGAPGPRVLHPGRLLDAHPGRGPAVGRPARAGLLRPSVPGWVPDRLAQHPSRAARLERRRRRDRGPAAGRLGPRLARALPAAAGFVVAAPGAVGVPVLPAVALAHPVVGGGHPVPPGLHLPVPRDLGPAAPAAGWQPLVGAARGAGHGSLACCSRSGPSSTRSCWASWRSRSPRPGGLRRIGVAFRGHLVVWVPLAVLLLGYVWLHRELAPIARTSAGSLGRLGRARGQLRRSQRRAGVRREGRGPTRDRSPSWSRPTGRWR